MYRILWLLALHILTDSVPLPTKSPTNQIITATSTTSTSATYQSSGITFQNGIITCLPLYYCYIYCNSADYACDGIVIDASAASYLRLRCESYDSTCQYINIIGAPKTTAYIYCYSENACNYGDMTLTSVSSRVNIDCYSNSTTTNGYGPCYDTQFRLSGTNIVNMDCKTYRSCQNHLYLDDVNSFTFNSDVDGAASGVFIYAQNVSSSANIIFNCNAIGSCTGGLYIFAPNQNDNTAANIQLNCDVDGACGSNIQLFIPNIFWDQLQLTCGTNTACDQVKFYCMDSFWPDSQYYPRYYGSLTYDATYNRVSCFNSQSDDNGCCPIKMKWGPTYTPTGTSIKFYCTTTNQCESAVLDFTAYETVTINCLKDNACAGMVVYGPQSGTPSLEIVCSGIRSCYAAYIDSKYSTTTTMHCLGRYACARQTIYYGDTNYELSGKPNGYHYCQGGDDVCRSSHLIGYDLVNIQIQCGTNMKYSKLTTSYTNANCGYMWGEFIKSNVNILCDQQYDCYTSFWTLPQSIVTIQCSAYYACTHFDVLGYDSTSINLVCNGEAACNAGIIQCPSTVEDACQISCDGGDYACRGIDFHATKNWILQYLDLTCDTKYTNVCDSIEIYCEFDSGAPKTNLLYDSNGVTCDPNNSVECCPFNTYSPTPSPTPAPTRIPTSNPTRNPLILKQGEICIDGYKEASYCEPCGINEAGTYGSCNECGNGKQPNNDHTECVLCDHNFIGLNGHCDIDCSQTNKIANELHTECVAMDMFIYNDSTEEKEYWYATAEFDAIIFGIGVLTGCSCIGAILYAFCKKKLCCAKSKDVMVTDKNNEIKNLNTAMNATQRIQIVSR